MTPKLYATFNIFEEADTIKEAITSVLFCDKIIVVDGAFPGFPSNHFESQDGTIEIVKDLINQYPNKIVLINFNNYVETQQKMQAYLNQMEYNDYFLRLNGDEIVETDCDCDVYNDLTKYVADTNYLPLYQIAEYMDGDFKRYHYCPKLLRYTDTLNLTSRHVILTNQFQPSYNLAGPKGSCTPIEANILPMILRIRHMKEHRSLTRQHQNWQWICCYNKHQATQML